MAFKRYTSCFLYPIGGKPYNEKDRLAFVVIQLLTVLVTTGVFAAFGAIGGPIGAVIGGVVGSLAGFTNMIRQAANQWLNHRLICLNKDNPQCAVGIVSYNPTRSDLGVFDNDQYFDVVLMPHPTEEIFTDFDPDIQKVNPTALVPANRYDENGKIKNPAFALHVVKHPENDILTDGFQAGRRLLPGKAGLQGQGFLSTRDDIAADLGYAPPSNHERGALHCEAEGDFWVRVRKLAPALAALLEAALAVTAAGAAAGACSGQRGRMRHRRVLLRAPRMRYWSVRRQSSWWRGRSGSGRSSELFRRDQADPPTDIRRESWRCRGCQCRR